MGHLPFSKPIFLKLHPGGNFQARGPLEAIEYLEHWWPAERTAHYRQAKLLCYAAVDGTVQPETARVALIEAANRAGVLAEPREVNSALANTTYVVGDVIWSGELGDAAEDIEVRDDDMVGYYRAGDILDDPSLSPSRKRALLAYWASDLHAVAGSPAFRRVGGVTISIDSIPEVAAERDNAERTGPYWGAWNAYIGALYEAGVVLRGDGLLPPSAATTVRLEGGNRRVQDGPVAVTKEQLAGYVVIEVPDLDAALAWAARCPAATFGAVEVRPTLPPPNLG